MNKTIHAVYSKGVLRPSRKLDLADNQQLTLKVMKIDDLPSDGISAIANDDPAYSFLNDEQEDIYSLKDGKPV